MQKPSAYKTLLCLLLCFLSRQTLITRNLFFIVGMIKPTSETSCNVSTLKHSPCPRLTVTPLNSVAFMLATSIRRIKGTCTGKACVELACAIITARPCYSGSPPSAPSEMPSGDFVSKSRCKDTNFLQYTKINRNNPYFFNSFIYIETLFYN